MIGTDGVLGVFVLGQLIFSTLKGGQRFLQTRTATRQDGPRFFQNLICGSFGSLRENYTHYPIRVCENPIWNSQQAIDHAPEGYSLSLKPDPSVLSNSESYDLPTQHNESSSTSSPSNETDITLGNASDPTNDFVLDATSEEPTPMKGVTIHIDYTRGAIPEVFDKEETNTSEIIMHDYCIEIPSHNQTLVPSPIQIRAYAAKEFAQLRALFGISEHAFRKKQLERGRAGRGIFFFSPDGGYLIKSIKKDEVGTFLKMLPHYSVFMKTNGRTTLLTRFCGMYDICIEGIHHTLVIMNAVFPSRASITERFDLKGSFVGRKVSDEERLAKGKNAVLKDLDFMESDDAAISLLSGMKEALFAQLSRDVGLLQNCSVIDYSLLVGVEPLVVEGKRQSVFGKRLASAFLSAVHGTIGVNGGRYATIQGTRKGEPVICYLGLIDFLQPFNHKKYFEWKAKSLVHKSEEFSCVPPETYARRILAFLDATIG